MPNGTSDPECWVCSHRNTDDTPPEDRRHFHELLPAGYWSYMHICEFCVDECDTCSDCGHHMWGSIHEYYWSNDWDDALYCVDCWDERDGGCAEGEPLPACSCEQGHVIDQLTEKILCGCKAAEDTEDKRKYHKLVPA